MAHLIFYAFVAGVTFAVCAHECVEEECMMRTMEDEGGSALSLLQATARVLHGSKGKAADDAGTAAPTLEIAEKVQEKSSLVVAADTPIERSLGDSDSDSEADVAAGWQWLWQSPTPPPKPQPQPTPPPKPQPQPQPHMETAVMNIIRHAEKCPGSGEDLSRFGNDRAKYLAKCMGSDRPSLAMPLGAATVVFAGAGHTSSRPGLTVEPLAQKLGLYMKSCSKLDPTHCFLHHALRFLSNKGTLVVAWAHLAIPLLMEEFRATHKLECSLTAGYIKWPHECTPPQQTQEPKCVSANGDSPCYDAIWQLKWMRPYGSNHSEWRVYAISMLSQGFNGNASGPCALDLAPVPAHEMPPFISPARPPGGRRRGGGLPPGWIK